MKVLVVYDSVYGNTEKVTSAIASAISGEKRVLRADKAGFFEPVAFDVLVVGSPTHAGRPTSAIKKFLGEIPANSLKNKGAFSFDTRASNRGQGVFIRALINFFGYASPRISKELKKKGADLIALPEGFLVKGKEGPLEDGELERAAEWAAKIFRHSRL